LKLAPSSKARTLIALGLAVVLGVSLLLNGVLAYRHGHLTEDPLSVGNSGREVPDDDVTAQVKAVAVQFATRMDSLDSADLPGYLKDVSEVLTTKCRTEFQKVGPGIASEIGKVPFKTKAYIRSSAVASLDSDSATVLVVHDALKTATSGQSLPSAFRWTISLRKVEGKWLVDSFEDPDRPSPCESAS
jgi:hypothetical protein